MLGDGVGQLDRGELMPDPLGGVGVIVGVEHIGLRRLSWRSGASEESHADHATHTPPTPRDLDRALYPAGASQDSDLRGGGGLVRGVGGAGEDDVVPGMADGPHLVGELGQERPEVAASVGGFVERRVQHEHLRFEL